MGKKKVNPNGLLPETAATHSVINWTGGQKVHAGKFGVIDLTTLSSADADKLIARGFKLIRRKLEEEEEKTDK